jgi:glucosamine-6-phosphate deaminase
MRIVVYRSAAAAARGLADCLAETLRQTPDLVMALPTGRTPILWYAEVVRRYRRGAIDFRHATVFALDEFFDIDAADPRSFATFLDRHLFCHVNLSRGQTHALNGRARAWRSEADRYEAAIARSGGLDFVVLGVGRNGHIGFNEPGPRLQARTHLVRLRPETRRANADLAGGHWRDVPTRALSMGMATIMSGRSIVLLATGASKAAVIRRALAGPVTTRVPASLLQLHPNVLVVLDRAAAAQLPDRRWRGQRPLSS